jgi:two-component system cell cycle response regulator
MRILIAEDESLVRRELEVRLRRWGYEVVVARDGAAAWDALSAEDAPALAILDWMMPELDGIEICRRLRAQPRESYTYTILLTGKDRPEDVIAGLDAGADDYIRKPFDVHELEARLRVGRRIVQLQSELVSARDAMRFQAMHDALTGLPNRRAALDALERELARAARERGCVTVVLADVDHFKRVNDTFGHPTGDAVLRHVADTMRTAVRPYDVVGRFGGEEFLLVLADCDAQCAPRVVERIRDRIAREAVRTEQAIVSVTCSFGLITTGPEGLGSAPALIAAADAALYRAKVEGRNRTVVSQHARPAA